MTATTETPTEQTEVEPAVDLGALATKAALLAAIKSKVEAEAKDAKAELEEALRAARKSAGTKAVEVTVPNELAPEGAAVAATIGFNRDGKPSVAVGGGRMPDCVEWVAERNPEWIREIVDPLYLGNLLKSLVIQPGGAVTDQHGEVIPWAVAVPGAPGAMTTKFTDNEQGKDALLASWLAGDLGGIQVGLALPGPGE